MFRVFLGINGVPRYSVSVSRMEDLAIAHTHTHARTRTHASTRTHARTHTRARARAHTHTHTHTHRKIPQWILKEERIKIPPRFELGS